MKVIFLDKVSGNLKHVVNILSSHWSEATRFHST